VAGRCALGEQGGESGVVGGVETSEIDHGCS
jgi:hypothetical protein